MQTSIENSYPSRKKSGRKLSGEACAPWGFWQEHLSHPCGTCGSGSGFYQLTVTLQLRHCAGGGRIWTVMLASVL